MVQKIITTITIGLFLLLAGCSITVEETTLDFGSAETVKTLEITIEGILKWKIQCDEDWVTCSPDHGHTTQEVTVTVDRAGLPPGDYEALVTIVNKWKIPCTAVLVKMSIEKTVTTTSSTIRPSSTTVPPQTTTSTVRPTTTTAPPQTTTTAPVTTTLPPTTTTTAAVTTTLPPTTTTTAPVTTTLPPTTTTTAPVTTTTTIPVGPDVTLTQETVFYSPLEEGGRQVKRSICLDNPHDLVGALQFDLCEYNATDEPVDCMECIDCELTERSTMFDCAILELPNGCCRVILFCKNPGCAINPGVCNIVTVVYTTLPLSTECPGTDCTTHILENIIISDYDGHLLTADGLPGDACPFVCGDVCPPDDPLLDGWDCGDGIVDLYDIMCVVDIALTATVADDCQFPRADVPNGTPPICGEPDGTIDILDIMVVTDMAMNRSDCCTFYYTGVIY